MTIDMASAAIASPYATVARDYAASGIGAPVPLPPGKKKNPPVGFTGAHGVSPTDEQIDVWAQTRPTANIGLRLHDGVLVVDVDDYDDKTGAATLAEFEARFGKLPATVTNTSRDAAGASRQHFFRVPAGKYRDHLAGVNDGVEILQRTHRYAVVWPSAHPEGNGRIYRWYDAAGEQMDRVPTLDELAELPTVWVAYLAEGVAERTRGTDSDIDEFLGGLRGGDYDDDTQQLLDDFYHRLNSEDGWGRFTDSGNSQAAMLQATMDLAIAGACGAPGAPTALAAAEDIFVTYRIGRGDTPRDAAGTWRRGLAGAIGYVREHGIAPLEPFEVPADIVGALRRRHDSDEDIFGARLIGRRGLASLPEPEPLIEDTLDRRTVALLGGYHGTGKSFVALGWAAAVATGTPWMGRPVRKGRVLYIVGEGAHGIGQRLTAWEQEAGVLIDDRDLVTYPAAVQIADPKARGQILRHLRRQAYDLIIIDTVARAAVGLDENSARDMGLFLDAAEEIKRGMAETGGTVLLVHHTGKDRQTIRGSSSVEAAMDTVYTTEGDPRNLRLRRTKRKDGPMEDMLQLRLVEVGPSAVLRRVDPGDREKVEAGSRVERSWVALATVFGDHAFTKAEAVTVLQSEEWGPLTRPTAYRAITDLVAAGLLNNVGDAKTTRFAVNRRRAKVRGLPDVRPMLEGVGELDLPTVEELSAD